MQRIICFFKGHIHGPWYHTGGGLHSRYCFRCKQFQNIDTR